MLYLVDVHKNICFPFPCEAALARWWRSCFGSDFSQLNVTGKDTLMVQTVTGHYWNKALQCYLPLRTFVPVLRRYRVLDANGRSIDIRTWDPALFKPAKNTARTGWSTTGSKTHWHRRSGLSMLRRTLRAAQDDGCADELADTYRMPAKAQLACRIRTVPYRCDREDYYDRRTKPQRSQSWKDQTKSRRQYAKHKSTHGRPVDKHLSKPQPLDTETVLPAA